MTAAIAQSAPVYFNKKASLAKALDLIQQAAGRNAQLVAFGETYVLDPVFDREELLICDLDLNHIDREMMTLDVSGHYSRPDLFRFETKATMPGEKLKTE